MDYTLGIYQSIGSNLVESCVPTADPFRDRPGYKEFHDYLNSPQHSETAFREAVGQMKLGTRRYAKRQVAWIRNKLLPVVNAANASARDEYGAPIVPTYLLDATGGS